MSLADILFLPGYVHIFCGSVINSSMFSIEYIDVRCCPLCRVENYLLVTDQTSLLPFFTQFFITVATENILLIFCIIIFYSSTVMSSCYTSKHFVIVL